MKSLSTIEAKFKRSGIKANYTMLWKDMAEKEKKNIYEKLNLLDNELVAICSFSDTYWWLITNERLIISSLSKINYYLFRDIKKIELLEIFNEKKTKYENTSINIDAKQGAIVLNTETNTWPVIYDILNFLIN